MYRYAALELRHGKAASDQLLGGIAEVALDAVIMMDDEGRIAFWNPSAERIFGYRAAEALDKDLHSLLAPSNFRREAGQGVRSFATTGTGKLVGNVVELTGLRKDGSEVPLEISFSGCHVFDRWWAVASVRDITERHRAREELKRYVARLENAMRGTVRVVSSIGELRDPYTHGHQQRVGGIAEAIAAKLGFAQEQLEGIRVMGYLHDVGKISVPAEILAKPSRLSAAEFEIVKRHVQDGYEILKGVEFPWPVADAVRDHHERLDGGGYPRGLKGDEINQFARILAVADTVEAMASHRPYRAALGIEAALTEIKKGCGTRYDERVAEACCAMFKEGEYRFGS